MHSEKAASPANRLLNPREREIVAYHEMGHALVALALPGSDPIPSYLSGTVDSDADGDLIVAIAVDGTVRAVTRTYDADGAEGEWEAMIEPSLLDAGDASVQSWLVEGPVESPTFLR